MTGDFSDVIAIQYTGPAAPQVEEGDTVRLVAVALGLDGEPLPEVTVIWLPLAANPDTVGFALDSLTGLLTAVFPGGPWNVQGRVEDLRVNPPIPVRVLAAPDSIAALAPARDTVPVAATVSAPLTAAVYDLTTTPGDTVGLAGKRVVFLLADPPAGSPAGAGVALGPSGQAPGADPHRVELTSGTGGLAAVTARRVAGEVQPDSIVVEAIGLTARGDTVPGSPARFVVFFSQN